MRAVLQRVSSASVSVAGEVVGAIETGLAVLVGVSVSDSVDDAHALADKIATLRVFSDDHGRMNVAVDGVGGAVLIISQFTLQADVRRGRRPSFTGAAGRDAARALVDEVSQRLADHGIEVGRGAFGESMTVELVNEGPVTIVIETLDGRVL